jgi:hypothetical protein
MIYMKFCETEWEDSKAKQQDLMNLIVLNIPPLK